MTIVTVDAPARLHLGFLDLAGDLGRRFVSLGVTIERLSTSVILERATKERVEGFEAQRVVAILDRLRRHWDVPPLHVAVTKAIPAHAGLGSGTQLGLAVGMAAARLLAIPTDATHVAAMLDRGSRSGIGAAAFAQGGFLLDGGKGPATAVPPLIARLSVPEGWRFLLLLDSRRSGLAGAPERQAFAELPPFTAALAARLCRLTLARLLPAVAEADIDAAGAAIGEIQAAVGDHFAQAQGGRFTSSAVADALAWLHGQGISGLGQSSWGPTGFALIEATTAPSVAAEAARRFTDLGVELVAGRNHGAEVTAG